MAAFRLLVGRHGHSRLAHDRLDQSGIEPAHPAALPLETGTPATSPSSLNASNDTVRAGR